MKKWMTLLFAGALIAGLMAGCGPKAEEGEGGGAQTTTPTAETPKTDGATTEAPKTEGAATTEGAEAGKTEGAATEGAEAGKTEGATTEGGK